MLFTTLGPTYNLLNFELRGIFRFDLSIILSTKKVLYISLFQLILSCSSVTNIEILEQSCSSVMLASDPYLDGQFGLISLQ